MLLKDKDYFSWFTRALKLILGTLSNKYLQLTGQSYNKNNIIKEGWKLI